MKNTTRLVTAGTRIGAYTPQKCLFMKDQLNILWNIKNRLLLTMLLYELGKVRPLVVDQFQKGRFPRLPWVKQRYPFPPALTAPYQLCAGWISALRTQISNNCNAWSL